MIDKVVKIFIFGLAFILPWQTRLIMVPGSLGGEYSEYGTLSLYGTDICLAAIIFLLAAKNRQKIFSGRWAVKRLFFQPAWFWPWAGFLLVASLSILIASDQLLAFQHWFWQAAGGWLALWLSGRPDRKKIAAVFLAGLLLSGLFGWAQFFFQSAPASKWLGLASHNPAVAGASVVEAAAGRWLRAYGSFDHPNILGGALALGWLLALKYLPRRPGKAGATGATGDRALTTRAVINGAVINHGPSAAIARAVINHGPTMFSGMAAAALFFTFSRSAWLAWLAGIAVYFFLAAWWRPVPRETRETRETRSIASVRVCVAALVICVLALFYHNLLEPRLAASGRLEEKSKMERMVGWQSGINILKNHLFLGAGLGNSVRLSAQEPAAYRQPAHNHFLLIAIETGGLGFLGWIAFWFLLARAFWRAKNAVALAVWTGLTMIMMFDHYFFSLHAGVLIFYFVLGLILPLRPRAFGSQN